MGYKLEILDPITFPGWDELILSNQDISFFHSKAWATVLRETYHYKPLYFTKLADSKISILLPFMEINSFLTGKRGVSLPFTDYCEPLVNQDNNTFQFLRQIIDYGKKSGWKYYQLRGGKTLLPDVTSSSYYFIHTLDLNGSEKDIFRKFRSSTKRNIKKAAKKNVEVQISCSEESMKEFYRLNCLTRKGHGLPPQPFHFFEKIYEHIISKNRGFVVLALYQQETIAAAVYFHFGKKAIYKYGASNSRYQSLRANNLVMWEAIKWYCENGYESFCFGRTKPENKGLMQFKSGWGTEQNILPYYKYDLRREAFVEDNPKLTGIHNKIFGKMPIPLLRLAGQLLYPHMA